MKVYVVFSANQESDGWTMFYVDAITLNKEAAKAFIQTDNNNRIMAHKKQYPNGDSTPDKVHPKMKASNNWTYFGKRKDCKDMLYGFGGYVVEEMEVYE